MSSEASPKRPRGRPIERVMPERIPDDWENVLRALVGSPPRDEDDWKYLKAGRSED